YFSHAGDFLSGPAVASQMAGQPESYDGEDDEDDQTQDVGHDERQYALENRRKRDVVHHALDDEHVHADRRMDQAELDRHDDDDAEPHRIEAELGDDREDDRHRQDDHRHDVHQAAQHQVHQHDQGQHAVGADAEAGEELRHLLRHLGDG